MFAGHYLERNNFSARIAALPDPDLGIAVVIPCFHEPDILATLESLGRCRLPEKNAEVIVLINHSETAPGEIKDYNSRTAKVVNDWIASRSCGRIRFFVTGPVELKKKWAGAGTARKAGMDEAVFRFNLLNKPGGIIVSLDADTLVEPGYLVEIEKFFNENPSFAGATLKFEHQKQGLGEKHLEGVVLYEKYMYYYKMAMGFTGYPYPMFTVGSAFAVTAGAYVKRGGMNRRQAGEDFYFLQNLVQVGEVGEILSTTVHPSSRLSARVPFGTGPVLQKWMTGEEDLRYSYNFKAFADLKLFFDRIDALFKISEHDYLNLLSDIPQPVAEFLTADDFFSLLEELNRNCSGKTSFQKRFFHKFNAFKILQYLNFTHQHFYEKALLNDQMDILGNAVHPV